MVIPNIIASKGKAKMFILQPTGVIFGGRGGSFPERA